MASKLTDYERERQANIASNQALLQQLQLNDAPALAFVPIATSKSTSAKGKGHAKSRSSTGGNKSSQPRKTSGVKRKSRGGGKGDDDDDTDSEEEVVVRRMSTRRGRRAFVDPNETPEQKAAREKEEERRALIEEQERLEALELAQKAKQPRHGDLELKDALKGDKWGTKDGSSKSKRRKAKKESDDDNDDEEEEEEKAAPSSQGDDDVKQEDGVKEEDEKEKDGKMLVDEALDELDAEAAQLLTLLGGLCSRTYPRATGDEVREKDKSKVDRQKAELREEMNKMKIVARAKVTTDRVYSMAYHPEKTKDILFFGDKHGQLGIWDPRALKTDEEEEGADGQSWKLQVHWPATAKSSISTVKFDPVDSHRVYTSAYDCTIRWTSLTSGVSKEIYAVEETLISGFDFTSSGQEMYISDTKGGVTHLDLRASRHEARRFQLSGKEKIGGISLNPVDNWSLLAACNDRSLKLWDTRMLMKMRMPSREDPDVASAIVEPYETDYDDVSEWIEKKPATLRGTWMHGFSVSSVYWDPSGTRILSTCYDDTLRVWDLPRKYLLPNEQLKSFRPAVSIKHDCQTGRWLTVFKAQWSQNPDVYPYFSVGDMRHGLKLFSADGDLLTELKDKEKITAVQAVTVTHPAVVGRAASGNASGRCVLWSTDDA